MNRCRKLRSLPLLLATALVLLNPISSSAFAQNKAAELEQLFNHLRIVRVQKGPLLEGEVRDMGDKQVNLSAFRGKVAFLTFWTTWCPNCRVEMPALEKVYVRYRGHGFQVLAVNIDEPAAKVAEYFKAKGLTYTSLLDPRGQMARSIGVRAVPSTFILDRRGIVLGKAVGARDWDSPEGHRMIQLLITDK